MTFNAGIARKIITPPPAIYLIGYGDRLRGNQGVHDDLTATALALDDGRQQVVIVACDLLAINEQTVRRILAQTGPNVVICCSHTHSGPITYADQRSPRKDRDYIDQLVAQITLAVEEAQTNLQPAQLAWAQGEAGIAVNRRERKEDGHIEIGINPSGPIDRSLGLLQVQTPAGKPIVSMVNYQCHGTVLGPKNLLVSADWIGAMRKTLEQVSGGFVMYLQGATGDLNPRHTWGTNDFEAAEKLGKEVGEQAAKALAKLAPVRGESVSFLQEQVWLALEAEADDSTPPPTYRALLARMAHVPRILVDFVLNHRYPWKTIIMEREGMWSVPVVLTQIRVGDMALYALGAEVFTEIGMEIKANSPTFPTLFASVSNGCIGYLPTAEEHSLGGYEIDMSPYFYRMPGRLNAGSADRVLEAVRKMQER